MKNLFEIISNQGVNWSVIWNDTGFLFCLFLFSCWVLFILWANRNWKHACKKEAAELYEKRNIIMFEKSIEIQILKETVTLLKNENERLKNDVKSKERKRDEKGYFVVESGKGHGRKKQNG